MTAMNEIAALFYSIGEPYAAGLFEEPDKDYFYRYCLAYSRYWEALLPAKYDKGDRLYPTGNKVFTLDLAVEPQYCTTHSINWKKLKEKSPEAYEHMRAFNEISHHAGGWTHSTPNYKRIIREGLHSYKQRILSHPGSEFHEGLLALVNAMENYLERSIAYLRKAGAPDELISALERVPFEPASTYYEGLVAWNIVFYYDGRDNLGCLDDGLIHLYNGEDLTDVIHEMFYNIECAGTWSCTVGPNYNDITRQALRAVKGRCRPMLELMTTPDMPDDIWELAIDSIKSGSTNPSFYNATGITNMLGKRFPNIPRCEIEMFCGCGCTETTLQGLTRAGGTDADIPLMSIFEEIMHKKLASSETFEEFFEEVCTETERRINIQLDEIADRYIYMSKYQPNPMRTLFTDDCIDKGLDFNGGGARYTWTQSSDSGLINAADSLIAIRELVYRKKLFTPEEFLEKLTAEDPVLYKMLENCPCFGIDNEDADLLAAKYAERVYMVYHNKPPRAFIDAYLLTEHQFMRYEGTGAVVGATPDGRHKGAPLCDSIAALRGKAVDGPTAMLRSAARLPQHLADGISVLNLTLAKSFVGSSLRALVNGYFAMGGIQVQVTCTSVDELRDAMEHPERHRDLIVRVGGYSEYFCNLSPALKQAVLDRNIHELN